MNQRNTLLAGAILGGLAVSIGAFGAHALQPLLTERGTAHTFELAVRYQFYHTLAVVFTGVLMNNFASAHIRRAAVCFVTGIVIFCGSLYILAVTGITLLGAVTPIGGVLFIAGWILLFLGINTKGLH
jgi:uncharacterized membrane protein YgdD (TMEM256/DUF423 family)